MDLKNMGCIWLETSIILSKFERDCMRTILFSVIFFASSLASANRYRPGDIVSIQYSRPSQDRNWGIKIGKLLDMNIYYITGIKIGGVAFTHQFPINVGDKIIKINKVPTYRIDSINEIVNELPKKRLQIVVEKIECTENDLVPDDVQEKFEDQKWI